MRFPTAYRNRIPKLYHWQAFHSARFEEQLKNGTVYCSSPGDFNDPWDCRPFFNTDLLADPRERLKHIAWAVDVCKRRGMKPGDIEHMRQELAKPDVLEKYIREGTIEMQKAVLDRYRVYCLGPDVTNILMWAHYADKHRGICLEFNVANNTICAALQVQYSLELPTIAQYSNDEWENLLPLLAKPDAWKYEQEFRLIAQERINATSDDTLLTDDGHLKLAEGALQSVIVGHLGPYEAVKAIVGKQARHVRVLRANIVPNKYQLTIGP